LSPAKVSHLQAALDQRDYVTAETLLLDEIQQSPHSQRAGSLLAYLGSIYFLNHDYWNAAVAWRKSDAISPLAPNLQFSSAMAYIELSRPDWARHTLESLAKQDNKNPLYVYWLGRLDYDAQQYSEATQYFQRAISLDPTMARAYDNLGLALYFQNQNDLAIENFTKAIELDQHSPHPSPWPYLNLAITLEFLDRPQEAEVNLRSALRIDPAFAPAHYRLGTVLDESGKPDAAIQELLQAASIDPSFAEPHITLAHIYNRQGRHDAAKDEVATYLRLHKTSNDAKPERTMQHR
jgi:tetratricopeptide (TPR) repeat protein